MLDIQERLADMDAAGVQWQVVSAAPPNFNYHLPSEIGVDFARIHNDALLELAGQAPTRLQGFAHLPLQDITGTLFEIKRVADESAVKGGEIGSKIAGRNLDSPGVEEGVKALASDCL